MIGVLSPIERKRTGTSGWRALAMAVLVGLAVSACGDDGPTTPKPASLPELFGDQLYRADGSQVSVQVLDGVPVIGVYFASPGCPACGGFTPLLVDAYTQLQADGRPFGVVLVSGGISEATLFEYMTEAGMPWLAVSSQSDRVNALLQRWNVRWVPTLIVIDGAGNILSLAGREDVTGNGAGAYDLWLAASAGS
jgi:fermentation-respiration switch protein FrsA (DUF1100 family)